VDLAGWLENFVCPYTGAPGTAGAATWRLKAAARPTLLEGTVESEELRGQPDFGSMGIGLLDFGGLEPKSGRAVFLLAWP
jgi:hypothetical protein